MSVASYPGDSLPRYTVRQQAQLSLAAHTLCPADLDALTRCLGSLTQSSVGLVVGGPEPLGRGEAEERLKEFTVLQLESGSGGPTQRAWAGCAPALATELVERALTGTPAGASGWQGPKSDMERGVLGYLAARALAEAGSPFHLRAVGEASLVTELSDLLLVPVRVRIDSFEDDLRMLVPAATLEGLPRRPRVIAPGNAARLPALLVARLGHATLRARELYELQLRDVVLPDRCALTLQDHAVGGEVELGLPAERFARFVGEVVGQGIRILSGMPLGGKPMGQGEKVETQGQQAPQTLDRIDAELPVSVSLELASFQLSLAELQALAVGEVLATGQPLGQHATLRVGERPIAEGELVQVDGQIGVRITRLAHPPG